MFQLSGIHYKSPQAQMNTPIAAPQALMGPAPDASQHDPKQTC